MAKLVLPPTNPTGPRLILPEAGPRPTVKVPEGLEWVNVIVDGKTATVTYSSDSIALYDHSGTLLATCKGKYKGGHAAMLEAFGNQLEKQTSPKTFDFSEALKKFDKTPRLKF